MKYTKYIALFSVLFFAACTTELIEPSCNLNGSGVVQLASRVVPFSDRDVTTRANKNEAENKISSIDYLIFGAEDKCIFHKRVSSIDPLLVDKSDPIFVGVNLSNCYIVSIANGPELNIELGDTTWDTISSQSIEVSGVSITSAGLPMVGRYPETGTFNFGGTNQGTVLTIPMKSLFAKIAFKLSVDAEEIRPGENQPLPTFTLTECTVHNLASSVDFIGGTESAEGLANGTNDVTAVRDGEFSVGAVGETADGRDPLTFSFYLPERFLRAGTSSTDFTYPFNRDEEQGYRQHYKPLLAKGYKAYNSTYDATKDKKATFVRLKGVYSNHQGHLYDVSYDIYVGNDNYGNFDIVRNIQYNNNVIIRGINNSSTQSPDLGSVSIDHRVNVERSAPIIINLRRETLLDSHFEVRPLLIRKNGGYDGVIPNNAKVKVEVEYEQSPNSNWIGLERSFGNGVIQDNSNTYLVDSELSAGRKNAAGKRKYFTTDLTTNTLSSSEGFFDRDGYSTAGGRIVVVPISNEDQRVWIYIDECTTSGDGVRSAKVKVSYDLDGDEDEYEYSDPIEYVLNQRLLYPVTYNNHLYNIEYHEEYLYNYDADDQYGETYYDGMKWGLDGVQLSYKDANGDGVDDGHRAMYVEEKSFNILGFDLGAAFTGIVNNLLAKSSPYYDFYLEGDTNLDVTTHQYAGYDFCNEIVDVTDIGVLSLGTDPKSAVEYCYNRNKRNADGTIQSVNWYLPAIDEIEEIMMGAYSTFIVFQDQYYWSCQPAYQRVFVWYNNIITRKGEYMIDNINAARATKANYLGNNNYEPIYSTMKDYSYYTDIQYSGSQWSVSDLLNQNLYSAPQVEVPSNGITLGDNVVKKGTTEAGYQPRTERNRIRCVYNTTTEN